MRTGGQVGFNDIAQEIRRWGRGSWFFVVAHVCFGFKTGGRAMKQAPVYRF
jgi:hypothetical protein